MPTHPRDPKAFTRWFRLDYFRRPRLMRRLYRPVLVVVLVLTAAAAAAGVAAVVLKPPGGGAAFQSAPVSTAHALFADRCEVCHVEEHAFHTALRLLPGHDDVSSVSDQACLQCHPAARHDPQQLRFVNDADGQAQECAGRHHEHRGDAALARLPDAVCTQCHADLHTRDGAHRYHDHITRFDLDHPAFGEWRHDPNGVTDPATIHFSHKTHLDLARKLEGVMGERAAAKVFADNLREAKAIESQGCVYCHKTDAAGQYMQPIRYADHCAVCHPLLPQLQPGAFPDQAEEEFRLKPLPHPSPGQDASVVRGELLDRFRRLFAANPPPTPPPTDEDLRPFFLNRPVPPLDERQRRTIGQVVQIERSLFADDPKDFQPLPGFDLAGFDVKGGCAFCHTEAGRSKGDNLPLYEPPQLPDRWFPHARFDHHAHRMMRCADCHDAADDTGGDGQAPRKAFLPAVESCKQCHNATAGKARSDCLECHGYHEHATDRAIDRDPPTVGALLKSGPALTGGGEERTMEIHPEARLERREGDLEVPIDRLSLYAKMSLFAGKEKDVRYFEKFPGTAVVRRYRRGEVVCRQGEPGWTAFYILTTEDVLRLLEDFPAEALSERERGLDEEKAALHRTAAEPAAGGPRAAASVFLTLGRQESEKRPGLLSRLFRGAPAGPRRRPVAIPIDGPTDLSYDERKATLREGDLFGEMSCLYRTPRSASVVADRDCYILEMLRNILDQLKRDAKFQKRLDDDYRARALDLQLRNIPLFQDLDDALLRTVRDRAELKTFRAGQILCDEHDRADDMFLVRNGLVKVVKGASSLFTAAEVGRWAASAAPAEGAAGPKTRVWAALPAEARARLGPAGDFAALSPEEREAVAHALNGLLKGGPLWTAKDFEAAARDPSFEARRGQLPANPKEQQEPDVRWLNRVLVETVLFGASAFPRPAGGLETVLHYAGRGESIGEMGLMTGALRSATCTAYIHPREGLARKDVLKPEEETVETVRISRALFEELKGCEAFRRKVEAVIAERRGSDVRVRETAPGAVPPHRSEAFDRLGLVQGQRLMLIDLDRCTRCDECVKACVNSHDDGRSRLFLEGPRFGHYLVPLSCRSCLDPVCIRGCPVGAIHRGDNRQMIIEDWCIGCELCARQCPYGSIQMHDIGVVPQGALGWRFRPAEGDGDAWTQPHFRDREWAAGPAPFRLGRDFEEAARPFGGAAPGGRVWFRLGFTPGAELLREKGGFNVVLFAPDDAARVWLNGVELQPEATAKKKVERPYPIAEGAKLIRAGRNVVAASVAVVASTEKVRDFFDLRIDVARKPNVPEALAAQYEEKDVTLRAVVCDLCSDQPGRVPACVNACPHDAAMRVNARTAFPTR